MDLFHKISIVVILGVIFGLTPLSMWFVQKRKNKNRIKKINIKQMMIFYYVGMTILIIGFVGFIYLKNRTESQPKIYEIPSTKIETHDEWFGTKESYYGSNRINYNEENKKKIQTIKASEITYLTMVNPDGSQTRIEGTPMINRTYTFYGLNGLGRGHHPYSEPNDLASFVKNPFNKWNDPITNSNKFILFERKNKYEDSQFFLGLSKDDLLTNTLSIKYEGPKYLLEEDKDFYMDEFECPMNKVNQNNIHSILKNYYLHFNPKQNYITLYTKKHNTKENK